MQFGWDPVVSFLKLNLNFAYHFGLEIPLLVNIEVNQLRACISKSQLGVLLLSKVPLRHSAAYGGRRMFA